MAVCCSSASVVPYSDGRLHRDHRLRGEVLEKRRFPFRKTFGPPGRSSRKVPRSTSSSRRAMARPCGCDPDRPERDAPESRSGRLLRPSYRRHRRAARANQLRAHARRTRWPSTSAKYFDSAVGSRANKPDGSVRRQGGHHAKGDAARVHHLFQHGVKHGVMSSSKASSAPVRR